MRDRRKSRLELKVGIFVTAALLILATMIVLFSDDNVFERGYRVHTIFNNISGIGVGGPVYLSGVQIGRIDNIRLAQDQKGVELVLWIKRKVRLPGDSEVTIVSRGVMGERFIEIHTDPASQAPNLEDGAVVVGKEPITLSKIFGEGDLLLGELKKTVTSINAIMADEELPGKLNNTVENINAALVSIKGLSERISTTIEINEKDIERSIALFNDNLEMLYSVFESIDTAEGTLGRLLKDDTIYKEFEDLVKDIRAHPWKLLIKTKEKKPDSDAGDTNNAQERRRRR